MNQIITAFVHLVITVLPPLIGVTIFDLTGVLRWDFFWLLNGPFGMIDMLLGGDWVFAYVLRLLLTFMLIFISINNKIWRQKVIYLHTFLSIIFLTFGYHISKNLQV
jgi:hypothetical protein